MRSRTSGHTSSIPGLHHGYPTSDRILNAVLSFTRLVKLQVAKLKLDSETYFKLEYQLVTVTPGDRVQVPSRCCSRLGKMAATQAGSGRAGRPGQPDSVQVGWIIELHGGQGRAGRRRRRCSTRPVRRRVRAWGQLETCQPQ